MEEYLMLVIYNLVGWFGAVCHWWKDRARGRTNCSLWDYIRCERGGTYAALVTIFLGELVLAYDATFATGLGLKVMWAAWVVGFAGDSAANKAPD